MFDLHSITKEEAISARDNFKKIATAMNLQIEGAKMKKSGRWQDANILFNRAEILLSLVESEFKKFAPTSKSFVFDSKEYKIEQEKISLVYEFFYNVKLMRGNDDCGNYEIGAFYASIAYDLLNDMDSAIAQELFNA